MSRRTFSFSGLIATLAAAFALMGATRAADSFVEGKKAFVAGDYAVAADQFRGAISNAPSAAVFHNLGLAEWHSGRTGPAILAWERAQWLAPFSTNSRVNLSFVRNTAQLEAPRLTWFEKCSTWLPVDAWAWLATVTFWLCAAMLLLPGVLRWRKADWQQGVAAACAGVFLLTVPALVGVHSRAKLGVILAKQTNVRLTPTRNAQTVSQLPAGEIVRRERDRGDYVFIRAGNDLVGWVERSQFGLIVGR